MRNITKNGLSLALLVLLGAVSLSGVTGLTNASQRINFFLAKSTDADNVHVQINFDDLSDLTPVTNQYKNSIFERATAITAGLSLNEFEAKPHSGSTVIFDDADR